METETVASLVTWSLAMGSAILLSGLLVVIVVMLATPRGESDLHREVDRLKGDVQKLQDDTRLQHELELAAWRSWKKPEE